MLRRLFAILSGLAGSCCAWEVPLQTSIPSFSPAAHVWWERKKQVTVDGYGSWEGDKSAGKVTAQKNM